LDTKATAAYIEVMVWVTCQRHDTDKNRNILHAIQCIQCIQI